MIRSDGGVRTSSFRERALGPRANRQEVRRGRERLPPLGHRARLRRGATMADDQRRARIFGVLFIITFLTSIPAALLVQPLLTDPAGYIAGSGMDTQI